MTKTEEHLENLSRTIASIAWDTPRTTPDDYIDLAAKILNKREARQLCRRLNKASLSVSKE